ncbi:MULTISPECIES: hypothetical protein [Sphingomonas]|nr:MULTISPECIES: hypothetical protein [Sphingomonas]
MKSVPRKRWTGTYSSVLPDSVVFLADSDGKTIFTDDNGVPFTVSR